MKLLKLTSLVALSATALLGGASVLANSNDLPGESGSALEANSNANISFIANDGTGDDGGTVVRPPRPRPDEERPEITVPPIPNPDEGQNTGPLTIAHVPHFDFGQDHQISATARSYPMIAEEFELKNTPGTYVPYVSWVQVQDTRGHMEGWTLQGTLSEFKTDSENAVNESLNGASITFENSQLEYLPDLELGEETGQAPTLNLVQKAHVLNPGVETTFMTADEKQGGGLTDIVWGDDESIFEQANDITRTTPVINEDIKFNAPANVEAATYTATLEWTLTSAPTK